MVLASPEPIDVTFGELAAGHRSIRISFEAEQHTLGSCCHFRVRQSICRTSLVFAAYRSTSITILPASSYFGIRQRTVMRATTRFNTAVGTRSIRYLR